MPLWPRGDQPLLRPLQLAPPTSHTPTCGNPAREHATTQKQPDSNTGGQTDATKLQRPRVRDHRSDAEGDRPGAETRGGQARAVKTTDRYAASDNTSCPFLHTYALSPQWTRICMVTNGWRNICSLTLNRCKGCKVGRRYAPKRVECGHGGCGARPGRQACGGALPPSQSPRQSLRYRCASADHLCAHRQSTSCTQATHAASTHATVGRLANGEALPIGAPCLACPMQPRVQETPAAHMQSV